MKNLERDLTRLHKRAGILECFGYEDIKLEKVVEPGKGRLGETDQRVHYQLSLNVVAGTEGYRGRGELKIDIPREVYERLADLVEGRAPADNSDIPPLRG